MGRDHIERDRCQRILCGRGDRRAFPSAAVSVAITPRRTWIRPGQDELLGLVEVRDILEPTALTTFARGIARVDELDRETILDAVLDGVGQLDNAGTRPRPAIAARTLVSLRGLVGEIRQKVDGGRQGLA